MRKENLLSRAEMKKVMGGNEDIGEQSPGGENNCNTPYFLACTTPNGNEIWCRSSINGNATTLCRDIYPAYNSTAVTGVWGVVIRP